MRPHRRQPTRLPLPGILQARTLEWAAISFSNAWKWKVKVKSLSRLTLSDPMDCSLTGSSVRGIFQARVLEWGAIAFSAESTLAGIIFASWSLRLKTYLFSARVEMWGNERILVAPHPPGHPSSWPPNPSLGFPYVRCANMAAPLAGGGGVGGGALWSGRRHIACLGRNGSWFVGSSDSSDPPRHP